MEPWMIVTIALAAGMALFWLEERWR